ncbi:MAG: C25 family cysteine peptidase [Caldilineaceae bacterium]
MQTLSAGAGVVVYNGHSHQWQWAVTDETAGATPDYLLSLYDTDALTNKDSYFIGLSMTCLTGQFQKPASSGTVLDERMLLNPSGGAVAVWGPAGLSVAHGHDYLQRGFFRKLWNSSAGSLRIGELVEAGYMELFSDSSAPQDPTKTFLLLGDPLTKVQVYPEDIYGIYLPTISR